MNKINICNVQEIHFKIGRAICKKNYYEESPFAYSVIPYLHACKFIYSITFLSFFRVYISSNTFFKSSFHG